jgi:hypothetical protein
MNSEIIFVFEEAAEGVTVQKRLEKASLQREKPSKS